VFFESWLRACGRLAGAALVGGETAEHPGLLGPDEYDDLFVVIPHGKASALLRMRY
jgi:phosphoribosylformylglycinamidine cyclo-ligase